MEPFLPGKAGVGRARRTGFLVAINALRYLARAADNTGIEVALHKASSPAFHVVGSLFQPTKQGGINTYFQIYLKTRPG
jgi:hypothetical protein